MAGGKAVNSPKISRIQEREEEGRARHVPVLGALYMAHEVPPGTALGIYGFLVLMSGRVEELLAVPPRPAAG